MSADDADRYVFGGLVPWDTCIHSMRPLEDYAVQIPDHPSARVVVWRGSVPPSRFWCRLDEERDVDPVPSEATTVGEVAVDYLRTRLEEAGVRPEVAERFSLAERYALAALARVSLDG